METEPEAWKEWLGTLPAVQELQKEARRKSTARKYRNGKLENIKRKLRGGRSPWILFCAIHRAAVQQANPGISAGTMLKVFATMRKDPAYLESWKHCIDLSRQLDGRRAVARATQDLKKAGAQEARKRARARVDISGTTAEAAVSSVKGGRLSENTNRNYRATWARMKAAMELGGDDETLVPLPLEKLQRFLFAALHPTDGTKAKAGGTVKNYVKTAVWFERQYPEKPATTQTAEFRQWKRDLYGGQRMDATPFAKAPLNPGTLQRLMAYLLENDRPLFLLLVLLKNTWMRGAEACEIRVGDVRYISDDLGRRLEVFVRGSKTDQTGKGALICVGVPDQPHEHHMINFMSDWKGRDGGRHRDELLIPQVDGDAVAVTTRTHYFRRRLHTALAAIGVPAEEAESAGLHAWRKGGATEAARAGCPDRDIQVFGRWKS
jgi:hypothetical protein